MNSAIDDTLPAQIEYQVIAAVLGPIISGDYFVRDVKINVSYPTSINWPCPDFVGYQRVSV